MVTHRHSEAKQGPYRVPAVTRPGPDPRSLAEPQPQIFEPETQHVQPCEVSDNIGLFAGLRRFDAISLGFAWRSELQKTEALTGGTRLRAQRLAYP